MLCPPTSPRDPTSVSSCDWMQRRRERGEGEGEHTATCGFRHAERPGRDRLPQRGGRSTAAPQHRPSSVKAGGHLRDRDVRIAQLEARVAEQDRQAPAGLGRAGGRGGPGRADFRALSPSLSSPIFRERSSTTADNLWPRRYVARI